MFTALDSIITALICAGLAVLVCAALWQFGLLPVVLVGALAALLTVKRMWLAAILGVIFGLS